MLMVAVPCILVQVYVIDNTRPMVWDLLRSCDRHNNWSARDSPSPLIGNCMGLALKINWELGLAYHHTII